MTRANKKSIIVTAAVCALTSVCGAVAYFTDRDSETNNFTIGSIDIDLQETFDPTTATNLAPTATVTKEPYVTNTSTLPSYIFMEVTVPKKTLVTAKDDGTKNARASKPLFLFTSTSTSPQTLTAGGTNTYNNKWEYVSALSDTTQTNSNKFVFVYNDGNPVAAGTNTTKLFNQVQLVNAVEAGAQTNAADAIENTTHTIGIKTYCIQSQGCSNYTDAYTKYITQNP